MSKREFKVLNEREHILTRPAMYIGSVVEVEKEQWLYDRESGKFSFGPVRYVPALLKICDEIVDNSLDAAIDTDFKGVKNIMVSVTDDTIEVRDDGPGIPVAPPKDGDPKGRLCPEIAWTQMRSGTSFKENRKGPSANGVGSTCCNVFCKFFEGTSDDGKKRQTVTCSDNMEKIQVTSAKKSSGKSGARVVMKPDLARFSIDRIDETHAALIYQRLLNLAISYPKINFRFNGKKIVVDRKGFGNMFSENSVTAVSDNATVVIFPNEYDEFRFYSYVNGLCCYRGGSQVDYVCGEVCNRVRDKLIKKYKSIRPGDVKARLGVVVFLTDFENAQFDAQTKESLANTPGDISRHLGGKIDFDALARQVLKTAPIIDPIVNAFRVKEELKARSELKASRKVKVRSDKYFLPVGEKKYLFLVEGQSAGAGLLKTLGRQGKGYYCLRGLALNAWDSSIQKISANQEVKDVLNILGLDVSPEKNASKRPDYEKIVIAVDQDVDGINICSMLLGWWMRFAPNLFAERRICKLNTPVVIVKDKKDKIVDWFFELDDFKKWEDSHRGDSRYKILYLKGLGSLSVEDLDYIIAKTSFEGLLQDFVVDGESEKILEEWLGEDPQPRKAHLRGYDMDINLI